MIVGVCPEAWWEGQLRCLGASPVALCAGIMCSTLLLLRSPCFHFWPPAFTPHSSKVAVWSFGLFVSFEQNFSPLCMQTIIFSPIVSFYFVRCFFRWMAMTFKQKEIIASSVAALFICPLLASSILNLVENANRRCLERLQGLVWPRVCVLCSCNAFLYFRGQHFIFPSLYFLTCYQLIYLSYRILENDSRRSQCGPWCHNFPMWYLPYRCKPFILASRWLPISQPGSPYSLHSTNYVLRTRAPIWCWVLS